jgi:RND family efflux transporter MFP subunit
MRRLLNVALVVAFAAPAWAEPLKLTTIQDWKAVYGQIEARDRAPARARIGGTLVTLTVTEGDVVTSGQVIATIVDQKLRFQLDALAAQRTSTAAQLENAKAELRRGEDLLKQGVTTVQRLDALKTQVDVLNGQLSALDAQSEVLRQTQAEGEVLSPADGRVLDVPLSRGAVVMPGDPVAVVASGGTFLRLAIPERLAPSLTEGGPIIIDGAGMSGSGRLVKVYPLVENGRVVADVEVEGLSDRLVDARLLVRLPIGSHQGLLVPASFVVTRSGLDFVLVRNGDATVERSVVAGDRQAINGREMVEVLSGLAVGDEVMPPQVSVSE